MKNKIKRLFASFVMMTVVVSSLNFFTVVSAEEVAIQVNRNAQSVYSAMRFKQEYAIITLTQTEQSETLHFPDNYAGIFIDDNDVLHVCYTSDVKSILNNNIDGVIYEKAEYSYNYLLEIYNVISSNMIALSVDSVAINEFDNKVKVAADESRYNVIIDFLKDSINNFDPKSILLSKPEKIVATDAGGSSIQTSSSTFTLGYNAYQASTGKYGFVTCAHAVSIGSTVNRTGWFGSALGSVSKRQYSGNIDAAFVPYNDQSNKTKYSKTGHNITGTYSRLAITSGMNVTKYGHTTGLTHGKVSYPNATIIVKEKYFQDQVQIEIRQEKGDSGGPVVFNFNGPIEAGKVHPSTLVGIATFANNSTWETAYISKAANINSQLGISTYI